MNEVIQFNIHKGMKEKLRNLSEELLANTSVSETNGAKDDEREDSFKMDIFSQFTITEGQIVGPLTKYQRSYDGNLESVHVWHEQRELVIGKEGLALVDGFVNELHKNNDIRKRASTKHTHRGLIDWVIKCKLYDKSIEFFDHYLSDLTNSCELQTVYVPIANLVLESEFELGDFKFVPMNEKKFDNWEIEGDEDINRAISQKRTRYQGYAAVVTTILAESEKAIEIAKQNAQEAVAYLRVFNSLAVSSTERVLIKMRGEASYEAQEVLVEREGQWASSQSGFIEEAHKWVISNDRLKEIKESSTPDFQQLSNLLMKPDKTAFEEKFLYVLWLFSQCILHRDAIEKLIHLLVSLETLFLKSETVPITQSIAEGLAFCTTSDLDFRKEIIKVVKDCYAVRSSYIHHGNRKKVNLSDVQNILIYSLLAYSNILKQTSDFQTKDEFLEAIENTKYS